jgi:hypothetical protein
LENPKRRSDVRYQVIEVLDAAHNHPASLDVPIAHEDSDRCALGISRRIGCSQMHVPRLLRRSMIRLDAAAVPG